jgi:hypothetical protein
VLTVLLKLCLRENKKPLQILRGLQDLRPCDGSLRTEDVRALVEQVFRRNGLREAFVTCVRWEYEGGKDHREGVELILEELEEAGWAPVSIEATIVAETRNLLSTVDTPHISLESIGRKRRSEELYLYFYASASGRREMGFLREPVHPAQLSGASMLVVARKVPRIVS